MDFDRLTRRRRMTRAFTAQPVDSDTVTRIVDLARLAPSAGNTRAFEFLVLTEQDTARYWNVTLPEPRRQRFAWPGLLNAPVLVVVWVSPGAYVQRYRETDKIRTGLGEGIDAWPVPYWFVDAGGAMMTMLLAAEAEGLGALLFGLFEHESAIRGAFGVPEDRRAGGVIALGYGAQDRQSHSAQRAQPCLDRIVHHGYWNHDPDCDEQ